MGDCTLTSVDPGIRIDVNAPEQIMCSDLLLRMEGRIFGDPPDGWQIVASGQVVPNLYKTAAGEQSAGTPFLIYVDVLQLLGAGALSERTATIDIAVRSGGELFASLSVPVDHAAIRSRLDAEAEVQRLALADGAFFDNQDLLELFIVTAQREREAENFEAALYLLDRVLSHYPGHKVAMTNRHLAEAEQFVHHALHAPNAFTPRTINPLLTMGLPAYDRPVETRQNLCVLVHQICQLDYDVEVIVSDNNMSSDNEVLINRIAEVFPFVRYRKNAFNVGVDQNVYQIYLEARGDFVYIIGDDDLLYPGALAKLMGVLSEQRDSKTNLLYFVPNLYYPNLRKLLRGNYSYAYTPNADLTLLSGDDAVRTFGVGLLRLSSLVFRRHTVNEAAQQYLIGYYVSPLALALSALTNGDCCVINDPIYAYRQQSGAASWSSKAQQIYYDWQPRLFIHMNQAGYFSAEATRTSLANIGIDYDAWLEKHDLQSARNSARVRFLRRRLVECVKGSPAPIDLLVERAAFEATVRSAESLACYAISDSRMLLHPSSVTATQLPIECVFSNVPAAPGGTLVAEVALSGEAFGAVQFLVTVEAADPPDLPALRGEYSVAPGGTAVITVPIPPSYDFVNIVLSTRMAPDAPNNHYASATFEAVRFVADTASGS
ncbi:glycosyltransferase family 2 protein [Roseomonas genomospecies 6]|uniref:Glycosyltransferase n=1 Tax=Roseomonas genomospecies 6 TaxID=214106 RepID=A0A9W7KRF5_9PROT|nr:glycosyltransferase [Roseomonas genomospecies 6]KAA0678251.1 glycosyltransferase [Roseomonas genomospecies 6]